MEIPTLGIHSDSWLALGKSIWSNGASAQAMLAALEPHSVYWERISDNLPCQQGNEAVFDQFSVCLVFDTKTAEEVDVFIDRQLFKVGQPSEAPSQCFSSSGRRLGPWPPQKP